VTDELRPARRRVRTDLAESISDGSHPTPSQLLRAKINIVSGGLQAASVALWDGPDFARLYSEYLCTVHAMLRASVPLMEAARERARSRGRQDALAAALADYLGVHIDEELNHDEWVLEDLRILGLDRSTVLNRIPSSAVAALVGSQYYWIFHHHPIAVLGYIAVLEGSPPEVAHLETVARRTGLPLEAFSTMMKHARLDPFHRDDLDRFLDSLPLTPADSALVGVSALHTVHGLCRVVEETSQ
jgi:Iron-containing redox enzyme